MAQRGRKSEVALQVVPLVPGRGGRPPPPPELDDVEARVWLAIVAALPAFWIDPAGEIVLRRLCAQSAVLERLEARLRQLRALGSDAGRAAGKLVAAHGVTAKTVAILMRELRATPRSRFSSRAAAPEIARTPKLRPWEIRARGETA